MSKIRIDEEKKDDIINGIKIPKEIYDISGMSEDIVSEIKEKIGQLTNSYDIQLDTLTIKSLGKDYLKVPFQFYPLNRGGYFEYELVVNKDYYFEQTLESYNARVLKNYDKGYLASKDIKDLITHEIAHVLTFQDCVTYGEFQRVEEEVREQFIRGVSGYADSTWDGAETIAEAFVRYRRGEELPDNVLKILNKYVERWKK